MCEVDLVVTRDSVCLGDDIDAPHEKTIRIRRVADTEEFINVVRTRYLLPSVWGGKVAWACLLNSKEIAVFWQSKHSCVALVQEVEFEEANKVHFKYYSNGRPEISGPNEPKML